MNLIGTTELKFRLLLKYIWVFLFRRALCCSRRSNAFTSALTDLLAELGMSRTRTGCRRLAVSTHLRRGAAFQALRLLSCAGRASGRAARAEGTVTRPRITPLSRRPRALLTRAVIRAGAVHPDRRRRAISPSAGPGRATRSPEARHLAISRPAAGLVPPAVVRAGGRATRLPEAAAHHLAVRRPVAGPVPPTGSWAGSRATLSPGARHHSDDHTGCRPGAGGRYPSRRQASGGIIAPDRRWPSFTR